jgi:hypothetical protein
MDIFVKFPRQIAVSSSVGQQTYTVAPGLYAIHGNAKSQAKDAEYVLNEGEIAVFKGLPENATAADATEKLSPVYTLVPGGTPAVPTGLVLVRFAGGNAVSDRKDEIKNAGYEVAETLSYAPNAGWLRARSGDIADALAGLKKLKEMPSVESIEPQMLMESARR